jgi:thiol-disulfide isomerase/thioredoxin
MRTKYLALWTAVLFLCCGAAGATTPGEVVMGGTLREASLRGLNGPDRKLSSLRGRAVLINVWASWCGPCREEMGSLERLAWSGLAGDVAIIGISTDDYPDKAQTYLQRSNATLSHYIDKALEMENMLGADRLPLTVLVSPTGKVLGKVYGARPWDGPESVRWIRERLQANK